MSVVPGGNVFPPYGVVIGTGMLTMEKLDVGKAIPCISDRSGISCKHLLQCSYTIFKISSSPLGTRAAGGFRRSLSMHFPVD